MLNKEFKVILIFKYNLKIKHFFLNLIIFREGDYNPLIPPGYDTVCINWAPFGVLRIAEYTLVI